MRNTTVALQVLRIRKKKKKSDDYWLGEIYVDVGVVSLDKFVKIGTQASVQYTGTITEQVG